MTIPNERLSSFISRLERLAEDKQAVADDMKEVFKEAKGAGYDTRAMKILLRERKMDRADLEEQRAILRVYRDALGDLADTPLGKAREPKVSRGARA